MSLNELKLIKDRDIIQFEPDMEEYEFRIQNNFAFFKPYLNIDKAESTSEFNQIELEQGLKENEQILQKIRKENTQKLEEIEEIIQKLSNKCQEIRQELGGYEEIQQKLNEKERENGDIKQNLNKTKRVNKELLQKLNESERKNEAITVKLKETQENLTKVLDELKNEQEHKKDCEYAKYVRSLKEDINKLKEYVNTVDSYKPMLETELNALLTNRCQENQALLLRMVEPELECSICSELFIEATTLNCTHTYCTFCILQWQNNQNNCPICRKHIESRIRTTVLDGFINKIVESLPDDIRDRRTELIKQRAGDPLS